MQRNLQRFRRRPTLHRLLFVSAMIPHSRLLDASSLGKTSVSHQNAITDDFKSLEEIDRAVREVGLVRSQLIFGIDYTISNLETGKHSFNGLSLHCIKDGLLNPYQSVRSVRDKAKAISACSLGDHHRGTNAGEIRLRFAHSRFRIRRSRVDGQENLSLACTSFVGWSFGAC